LIYEFLNEKGGLTDAELYDVIREKYGHIGFGELKKTLMKMEILGKIHVSKTTRGRMRVEMIKP
jgi:hypothetical protein